jgi:hypothetical protein
MQNSRCAVWLKDVSWLPCAKPPCDSGLNLVGLIIREMKALSVPEK